jgi:TOBE domain-containing protein
VRSKPVAGAIEATVTRVRDLGAAYLVELAIETSDAPLVAKVPAGTDVPRVESECWVELRPGKAHLFRDGHLVPETRPMAASVEGAA